MHHITMAANGRLVVPAPLRSEIGMPEGGALVMSVQNGKLILEPYRLILERVRAEVRQYVPDDVDLAEELSRDRREEAARE